MTLRAALEVHLTEKGIRDKDDPPGQLYQDDWFRVYVGHWSFRVLKLGPMIKSLALHDAHHLITGYGTDLRGEAELVGWELASGGCGRHGLMWIDRIFAFPLMLFFPRASLRAIQRGWREQNLYCLKAEQALALDFDDARRRIASRALLPA